MKIRKNVLILSIIAGVFAIAAAAMIVVANADNLGYIGEIFSGMFADEANIINAIPALAVAAIGVGLLVAWLVVDIKRHKKGVIAFALIDLVATFACVLAVECAVPALVDDAQAFIEMLTADTEGILVLVDTILAIVAFIMTIVLFIVDVISGKEKADPLKIAEEAAQMKREEEVEEVEEAPEAAEEETEEDEFIVNEPEKIEEPVEVKVEAPVVEEQPKVEEAKTEEPKVEEKVEKKAEEKPAKKETKPAPKKEEAKKEEKKESPKKAESKKEEKKAPAKKADEKPAKKEEAKPAPKKAEEKPAAKEDKKQDKTKVYHVSKRALDEKWVIKFAGGSKVIKTFRTKVEAVEFAEDLANKQGGIVLVHASKGKNAGKINEKI